MPTTTTPPQATPRAIDVLGITRQTYLDPAVTRFPLQLTFFHPDGTELVADLREEQPGSRVWVGVVRAVRLKGAKRPSYAKPYGVSVTWDRPRCTLALGDALYLAALVVPGRG